MIKNLAFQEGLSHQAMFKGLSASELEVLAQGTLECRYQRNETLFQKGDDLDGMYIVLHGQIKVFMLSPQGTEKVVHMAGAGNTFGEALVFLDKPAPVSAIATQDSVLLLVRKNVLLNALTENPILARKMLAGLSMRLHELIEDMELCMMRSSMQRVVCFLSNQRHTQREDGTSTIHLDTSKQTIASQLNLTPETFSRALHQLTSAGLIQVKGKNIEIMDRDRLLTFAA